MAFALTVEAGVLGGLASAHVSWLPSLRSLVPDSESAVPETDSHTGGCWPEPQAFFSIQREVPRQQLHANHQQAHIYKACCSCITRARPALPAAGPRCRQASKPL
jgi:hypothetical protein